MYLKKNFKYFTVDKYSFLQNVENIVYTQSLKYRR